MRETLVVLHVTLVMSPLIITLGLVKVMGAGVVEIKSVEELEVCRKVLILYNLQTNVSYIAERQQINFMCIECEFPCTLCKITLLQLVIKSY